MSKSETALTANGARRAGKEVGEGLASQSARVGRAALCLGEGMNWKARSGGMQDKKSSQGRSKVVVTATHLVLCNHGLDALFVDRHARVCLARAAGAAIRRSFIHYLLSEASQLGRSRTRAAAGVSVQRATNHGLLVSSTLPRRLDTVQMSGRSYGRGTLAGLERAAGNEITSEECHIDNLRHVKSVGGRASTARRRSRLDATSAQTRRARPPAVTE